MKLPPFERIVERHGDDVWRFSVSQVGIGRADDVFQETMVAALAAYPTLRDPAAVRPWLLRIAARKAVDRFRADARAPAPVDAPEPPPVLPPDTTDDALWTRVRRLPEKQRQAVALRVMLDLRYTDVAAAMDTSVEAARRNVFEGLRTLRAQLEGAA